MFFCGRIRTWSGKYWNHTTFLLYGDAYTYWIDDNYKFAKYSSFCWYKEVSMYTGKWEEKKLDVRWLNNVTIFFEVWLLTISFVLIKMRINNTISKYMVMTLHIFKIYVYYKFDGILFTFYWTEIHVFLVFL